MVVRLVAVLLPCRMPRPRTSSPLVKVAAQTLDDLRPDMLAELYHATVEVAVLAPADLGRAFAVSPVVHQLLGATVVVTAACAHSVPDAVNAQHGVVGAVEILLNRILLGRV